MCASPPYAKIIQTICLELSLRQEEERFECVTLLRHTFVHFLSSSYVILTSTFSSYPFSDPEFPANVTEFVPRDEYCGLLRCCYCSKLLGTIYSLSSYSVPLSDYFCVLPIPWVFFSMISIPGSSRPPDVLLYITPYLLFYGSYIILYYCTLLSMSRVIYTTMPDAVCTYTTCSTNL